MTTRRTVLLACVLLLTASLAPHGARARALEEQPGSSALSALGWLAGDWSADAWGGRFHAHYTSPQAGKVLSFSRLVRDGKDAYHEFEVFERVDGAVRMTPFPRGARAVALTLVEGAGGEREAVFENPDKDWPTRIVYASPDAERLVITLSDPHGGSDKVEVFDFTRADAHR